MIELGQQDIQRHFDVQAAAKAVKAAYVATAQGRVQAPPVTYLGFPAAEGDCHVKTGHIAGDEAFARLLWVPSGRDQVVDHPLEAHPATVVRRVDAGDALAPLVVNKRISFRVERLRVVASVEGETARYEPTNRCFMLPIRCRHTAGIESLSGLFS